VSGSAPALQVELQFLRQQLAHCHDVLNALPGGMVRTARDGTILFCSDPIREVVGYAPEELVAQPGLSFIDPADHQALHEHLLEVKKLGRSETPVLLHVVHRDGAKLRCQASYAAERDEAGRLIAFTACYRLLDQRASGPAFGPRAPEWLDLVREMSDSEYLVWFPGERFVSWSIGAVRLLGFDGDEQPESGAEDWMRYVVPDDRAQLQAHIASIRVNSQTQPPVIRVCDADSSIRWLALEGRYGFDAEGELQRAVLILKDVSESMRAAQEQQRRGRLMQNLLDAIPDAVLRINRDLEVIYASPAVESMFGVSAECLLGKRLRDVSEDREASRELEAACVVCFDTGASGEVDLEVRVAAEVRHVQARYSPETILGEALSDGDGPETVIILARDLTLLRRAMRQTREAATRLERLLNASEFGVVACDAQYRVNFCNLRMEELLGLSSQALLETDFLALAGIESGPTRLLEELAQCKQSGAGGFIDDFQTKRGARVRCRVQLHPVFSADGNLDGYLGYWFDQSELVTAEQRVHTLNDRLKQVLASVSEGIAFIDAQGVVLFVNRRLSQLLGREEAELADLQRVFGANYALYWRKLLSQDGATHLQLINARQELVDCLCQLDLAIRADGSVEGYLLTVEDASQHLRSRLAINRLHKLLDTAGEGVLFTGADERVEYANQTLERLLGYPEGGMVGLSDEQLIESVSPELAAQRAADRRLGLGEAYDARLRRFGGSSKPCALNVTPLFDENGDFEGTLVTIADLEQRQELQRVAQVTVEWLEAALGNAGIGSFDIDLADGQVRTAGLVRELYPEPFNFDRWLEYVDPEYRMALTQALSEVIAKRRSTVEFRDSRGSKPRWLYGVLGATGEDVLVPRVIGTLIDVTHLKDLEAERAALQEQLAQGQRHESMGLLAGGIAHDFNNLLTSAVGNLELAKMQVKDPKEVSESLSMIDQALVQMSGLARQLQTYSGRGKGNLKPVDLNSAIHQVAAILKVSAGPHAQLELHVSPHKLPMLGDATQLQQIVMNLVINASEALGEKGGVIRLSTSAVTHESIPDTLRGTLDGPCGLLEVSDNGPGMPSDVRQRVFEPFFSSKANGRGLGLAVVLGAVKSHQAAISVDSAPGAGTTFRIWFQLKAGLQLEAEKPSPVAARQKLTGKVLLVDDEDGVRGMVARAISMRGLTVIEATNGRLGVDAALANPDVALVVMDIVMPVLGGVDAFLELRRRGIKTPVILMSGFAERQVLDRLGQERPLALLRKPFRPAELLKYVDQVFAASSA